MIEDVIDKAIRKKLDFPRKGIQYYDITGITVDSEAFRACIDEMYDYYKDKDITRIAGIEARGFVFAAPLAYRMHLPLVLVRKKGKLSGTVFTKEYALEYGLDSVSIQMEDFQKDDNILIVDDLIATGGTFAATAGLFVQHGAHIAGCLAVVGLPYLDYDKVLSAYPVHTLITYQKY
ncbi:MAG: adenine phosphoribosyltransferase [Sphaerochaetaceae bacterium]